MLLPGSRSYTPLIFAGALRDVFAAVFVVMRADYTKCHYKCHRQNQPMGIPSALLAINNLFCCVWCPERDLNPHEDFILLRILSPLCLPISPSGRSPALQARYLNLNAFHCNARSLPNTKEPIYVFFRIRYQCAPLRTEPMPIREIFKQTLTALWESKLRSFLTMFGIVWGITSVILLVGLGIGFNVDQKEHLRSIGTDIAIFFGGKTGAQAGGYAAGRDIRLTIDDAIAIQQQATLVKTVSPELRRTVAEVSQWNAASRAVRGVWPQYQRFRSLTVEQGRLMSEQDEADGARVILLGAEANRQLFPGKAVIGQPLMVAGYQYTVIGVLTNKKQNGSYGSGPDNTQLFAPYSAMARD